MREGFKSLARMLPDVSSTNITVASRKGVIKTVCGLAKAAQRSSRPKHKTSGGIVLVL
jgi:hypothetical protein